MPNLTKFKQRDPDLRAVGRSPLPCRTATILHRRDPGPELREGLLDVVLRSMVDIAVIAIDRLGRVTTWNEGARRMLGWTETAALGRDADALLTGDGATAGGAGRWMDAGRLDEPFVSEGWCRRHNGAAFWARTTVTPLVGRSGDVQGALTMIQDRTSARREKERSRIEAELLRGIMSASRDCIDVLHLDGTQAVEGRHGPAGCAVFTGAMPDDGRAERAFSAARHGDVGHFDADTGDAGTAVQWDVQVSPIMGSDGRPDALLAVSRDVTAERRAAEQSRLLMMEMSHRMKNVLAVVQAIASQTLRGPTMPADLRETFDARLMTLFHAQDILTQTGRDCADLRQLVDGVAALHCGTHSPRFRTDGPTVTVGPRVGLSLAMVLHELGTNAIKYGALSSRSGSVDLVWNVLDGPGGPAFHLTWTERGGPPAAPPTKKGFGTRLIELSFPRELGLTSTVSYPPEGVVFTLDGPLASVLRA